MPPFPPALLLVLAAFAAVPPAAGAQPDGRRVARIGVVLDGPGRSGRDFAGRMPVDEAIALMGQEIRTLTEREFDVRFPVDKRVTADWTPAGIDAAIDRLLADPDVDLVVTLGVFGTSAVTSRRSLFKPVVALFVVDTELQGIPREKDASGVRNLNYLTISSDLRRDLREFHDLVPFRRVHVVHDARTPEFLPTIYDYVAKSVEAYGAESIPVPADTTAADVLGMLGDAEAVFVTPLPQMSEHEFTLLVEGLTARGLPTFSILGEPDVRRGILAGHTSEVGITRLMRRLALNVQRILLGEDAGTLPVTLDGPVRLMLNMATARAIDWYPRWSIRAGAELLHAAPADSGRSLSLGQAIGEAIAANLDLRADEEAVRAGSHEVAKARAALLPQVDLSATGVQIDETRAEGSLGAASERTLSGKATLTQVLYSDPAWGNYAIQRHRQRALEFDRDRLRFDVALEAATAFLNVLRAQTAERITKENLKLTQSNYELARRREKLGASGPADVYRWESQRAGDQRDVIAAERQTSSALAALNRILNRPQGERIAAIEPNLDDPDLRTGRGRLLPYVDNENVFETFTRFAVESGLEGAPELQRLDAAIAAQRRVLTMAQRRFWIPDIALFGDVGRDFDRSGAGSSPPMLPAPFDALSGDTETEWTVGVKATLPLFRGGERFAEAARARREVERLTLERRAAAERIELRVRTSLDAVASSSPAIGLNRESAAAARHNLELVTDLYSQGVVSIIQLLDAQNAALVADLLAANAVYDFLTDLMELQRSLATMDYVTSAPERDAWFERLEGYFRDAGVSPIPPGR